MEITRRRLVSSAALGAGLLLTGVPSKEARAAKGEGFRLPKASDIVVKEAAHWEALDAKKVKCVLCPRECSVADMERGYCGVRENRDGKYYTLVHSRPCAVHVDPIEKKPLFHYLPGTKALSIGTAGCNMECLFCQNWNISQFRPEQVDNYDLPPAKVVEAAQATKSQSIACTYNEPVIFYEYVRDCGREGRNANIPTVMISNGYIKETPMRQLVADLGAVKIDLKSFTEKFYVESCHGTLQPVLDTLKTLRSEGIWFEIVVLLVTGLNDTPDEVKKMAEWIVTNLGPDVPLHFSRYFPCYKLQLPQTPVDTMAKAFDAAKSQGVDFVYVGNIELPGRADTICPSCASVLVKRLGYLIVSNTLTDGKCPKCGRVIPGIWRAEDSWKRGVLS